MIKGEPNPESPGRGSMLPVIGGLIAEKYRVDRILGVGGMGVVVAATHLDLDRPVAIKMIRHELAKDESTLQRFMLEARAAAKINSEHVCQVLDVGRLADGAPFIVMELLLGLDLAKTLELRGRIAYREGVDWMLQVCEGLAEAHAANIVHRDLKPDNLFLTQKPDGSVCMKVLDFGISKRLGARLEASITGPQVVLGSPQYMAPEQLLSGEVDERADIWALGAILYEMTLGAPAFGTGDVGTICTRVVAARPTPPRERAPDVPVGIEAVILRCLSREPGQRFRDVAALAAALAPHGSELSRSSSRKIEAMARRVPRTLMSDRDALARLPALATKPSGSPAPETDRLHAEVERKAAREAPAWRVPLVLLAAATLALATWVASHRNVASKDTSPPPPGPGRAARADVAPRPAPVLAASEPAPVTTEPSAAAGEPATLDGRVHVPPASPAPQGFAGQDPPTAPLRAPSPPAPATPPRALPSPRGAGTPEAPALPSVPLDEPRATDPTSSGEDAWNVDNFGGRR